LGEIKIDEKINIYKIYILDGCALTSTIGRECGLTSPIELHASRIRTNDAVSAHKFKQYVMRSGGLTLTHYSHRFRTGRHIRANGAPDYKLKQPLLRPGGLTLTHDNHGFRTGRHIRANGAPDYKLKQPLMRPGGLTLTHYSHRFRTGRHIRANGAPDYKLNGRLQA